MLQYARFQSEPHASPSAANGLAPEIRNPDRVAILLGTKDGALYLPEQLQSYADQHHSNWALYASDDGSSDDTAQIILDFAATSPNQVSLRPGAQKGFARNFTDLTQDPEIQADFYAFSDQDDIWCADKLARALAWLKTIAATIPAIYFTRTELIDAGGRHLGYSPLFKRPPSFQNALVQNIGGGNTMVFNQAAKRLLETTEAEHAISHDWWAYQIITAVGGVAYYDPLPTLKYRQHRNNVLGQNASLAAKLRRIRMLLAGRVNFWNDRNLATLQTIRMLMVPENRQTLDRFVRVRAPTRFPARFWNLARAKVYRQTILGNLGLVAAAALRKL